MDINLTTTNSGYPIYDADLQAKEIDQSQRPREEIEAQLAAAKEALEKTKAGKKLAEEDLEQTKKDLEDKINEYDEIVERLERTSPVDSKYKELHLQKENLEIEIKGLKTSKLMREKSIDNWSMAIELWEWKIQALESELNPIDISDINGLPPKPKPELNAKINSWEDDLEPLGPTDINISLIPLHDSIKPSGLFDLFRKEPEKLS